MTKVGFIGNWYYTPRGHSYVVRDLIKILQEDGIECHMFRMGNQPKLPEFPEPTTIKSSDTYMIPKEDFEKWLDEVKPDFCVFSEYQQWWKEDHNKIDICKARGIKPVGWLVWEKLDWNDINEYKKYYKIICPSRFQTLLMRSKGLYNTTHVPWGIDFSEVDTLPKPERTDKKIRFYHCGGAGGVDDRKNTQKVIEAYKKIQDENTDLLITHLNHKAFSKSEIYSFMKYCDVLVNPSKWETIGIPSLEANVCGIPVITTNYAPMNEFVVNNINGLLVDGIEGTSKNVTCVSYDISVEDLAKKMAICKNEFILNTLKGNSRKFAEMNFNWNNNKVHVLKIFRGN